jgi:predicted HAD superfamily Cof-like phosphohydrolase
MSDDVLPIQGSQKATSTVRIDERDLRRLLAERDQLREQNTQLQTRMSAMVEETLYRRVRAFHAKFGHPVRHTPQVPEENEVRFRLKLITEEFRELLQAAFGNGALAATAHLQEVVRKLPTEVLLPEFYDALLDLAYVIEGTHAVFGTRAEPGLAEVQRANMAKHPNGADGKPVKPADWEAPQIERVLAEQGWKVTP